MAAVANLIRNGDAVNCFHRVNDHTAWSLVGLSWSTIQLLIQVCNVLCHTFWVQYGQMCWYH